MLSLTPSLQYLLKLNYNEAGQLDSAQVVLFLISHVLFPCFQSLRFTVFCTSATWAILISRELAERSSEIMEPVKG